jgi:hypothetical protein
MEVAIKKRALSMRETPPVLIDPTDLKLICSRVKGKEASDGRQVVCYRLVHLLCIIRLLEIGQGEGTSYKNPCLRSPEG